METVGEFTYLTYLGDRVRAGGGCEAAVTARTTCGLAKLRECGELLYGWRFPLQLKGAVHRSHVWPAILCRSETWCLKESEMGILQRSERSMVIAMCGVQRKDLKKSKDSMLMLDLNETIDQLAMANSVHWCGHVLRRENGHVLEWNWIFSLKVNERKEGRRGHGRSMLRKKV